MSATSKRPLGTAAILAGAALLVIAAAACHSSGTGRLARIEVHRVKAQPPCPRADFDPCPTAMPPPPPPACTHPYGCAPRRLLHASGSGARLLSCAEGGCVANIDGSGSVLIQCAAGGCDVNASGSGSRVLMCSGGNCTMTCRGSGSCLIVGCGESCHASCAGSGTCGQGNDGGWVARAYPYWDLID